MSNARIFFRSFAGGEISPEMWGRIDDVRFQTGLATCRNFITRPQGPAVNRAGTRLVRAAKIAGKKCRLVPFTFSTTQTMAIEMGEGYFRFHSMGATLLDTGVPYEVAHPYTEAELFDVHYVQSADVLTFVHPNHAPRELRRLAALNWQLVTVSFVPAISFPGGIAVSNNGSAATDYDYRYVVTSVAPDALTESSPSASYLVSNNLFITGSKNTISWSAVAGAATYRVYKEQGGQFGFIGSTPTLTMVDDNIAPDLGITPPIHEAVFNSANNYPGAVSYFEQRRCFAGTAQQPQSLWMTRSGTESGMSYSLPVRDDDRIAVRVAARESNTIRHIVPLSDLMLLTSAAEWRVTSVNSDAITPSSISVRPQSYVGASNVQPVIINNTMLYGAARGGHLQELGFNAPSQSYASGDLCLRSAHLFDTFDLTDLAYAKAPTPVVWAVSSSGKLLGLTYVPEQQVGAWHQHDTDGAFESCCVVAEGQEDVLYVAVRRTIGGATVRYVERMGSRAFAAPADAYFVDAGITYSGALTSTISGLGHLEGKTVSILADGSVHPSRAVAGGAVTLDEPAAKVHVGLPIEADIQTLPLTAQVDGAFGQGRAKNISKVWLRVFRSSGVFVGPDADRLTEAKQRTTETPGSPPALRTEDMPIMVSPSWNSPGHVFIRQRDPVPLTVVGVVAEVSFGG
jgi:hypothetical protein